MENGLNFYRLPLVMILSFVSFWGAGSTLAQAADQAKDEFSLFDEAAPQAPAAKKEAVPVVKAPAIPNETSAQKIERLKTEIRKQPKNIGLIEQLAEELSNSGDTEKATLLLWKYVDKLDRQGLMTLAQAHMKRHEPSDAIRALNILTGRDAKDFEALTMMGDAHAEQKKTADALDNYTAAQQANPKYEPAYLGSIKIYEVRTPPNYYDMRILYQDMITHIGSKPAYQDRLCEINAKDKSFDSAINTCKVAIEKDPKMADNYVYLGISYRESDQEDLSMKTLKQVADQFPHSALAQTTYAQVLSDKKDYVDSLKYFSTAITSDAKSDQAWLGVATSAFELRKYDMAYDAFRKACMLNKRNASAFRRATNTLRSHRNVDWLDKYESASDTCML